MTALLLHVQLIDFRVAGRAADAAARSRVKVATRRVLRGVLNELAISFVGRNNDLDGYWAMGQLRSFADRTRALEITFDLIEGQANPPKDLPQKIALAYAVWLRRRLTKLQLPLERVARAEVRISFGEHMGESSSPQVTWGDPFTCFIRLTDDRGVSYARTVGSWCGPHDSSREWRRAPEHRGLAV